jgi:hypothetical protein
VSFTAIFGDGIWADAVWADLYGLSQPPIFAARGIGGEGFPPNWEAIIARNAAEDEREKRRLEEEIALLRLAGLI